MIEMVEHLEAMACSIRTERASQGELGMKSAQNSWNQIQ